MTGQLPILLILLPLIGALMTIFTGRGVLAWLAAVVITAMTAALSINLLLMVSQHSQVTYELGNWSMEYGIVYQVDYLNAFVLTVVASVSLLITVWSWQTVRVEIPAEKQRFFYSVWLLLITGLLGITITGDAFNVYVLLEISALSTYTLIALGKFRDRRALTASLKYLVLGSVGACFILLSIGYLLMTTGTLNMVDIARQLRLLEGGLINHRTILTGFALFMTGVSLKMGLFPAHGWMPNAYAYAPSSVSALLAAISTKVAVYMLFRFVFTVYGADFAFGMLDTRYVLLLCGCGGVVFCSITAIRQHNIKKMLAYSSVAQVGYMMIGLSVYNQDGLTAAIVHILNHGLIKGTMFMALGGVALRMGGTSLRDLKGLGNTMPFSAMALTAGGISLIGFPLTAGFISKWYLVKATLQVGWWPVTLIILIGTLLAMIYVWRIVETLYFQAPDLRNAKKREAPLSMVIPMMIMAGLSLVFGTFAAYSTSVVERAVLLLLMGVGQ